LVFCIPLLAILIIPAETARVSPARPLEVLLCNPLIRHLEMNSTWEAAKAVGVRGIEIHVESDLSCSRLYVGDEAPYNFRTPEDARQIQEAASKAGLVVPIVVAPVRLVPADVRSSGAPEWAKTLVRNAGHAGVELVYFPIVTDNFLKPTLEDQAFVDLSVRLLQDLVSAGKESGLKIGIENLSVYWNRPKITRRVLSSFDREELGLCLDPVNLYWYGHPRSKVNQMVRDFLPRTIHFHAKNIAYPVAKREREREPGWKYGEYSVTVEKGDLDFERYVGELLSSGYQGYISVEDDSLELLKTPGERLQALQADVAYLRTLVEGYRIGTPVDPE
jgi:sugar phosphate isomerase/epimerase